MLTIVPVEFIYVVRVRGVKRVREEEETSMLSNERQFTSMTDGGAAVAASGRTCAGTRGEIIVAAARVACPSSIAAYLPGGKLMREGAESTRNLWISDRPGDHS